MLATKFFIIIHIFNNSDVMLYYRPYKAAEKPPLSGIGGDWLT